MANFQQLLQTTVENLEYETAVSDLSTLYAQIAAGTKFENAETENIAELKSKIASFDYIQRVKGNKIYNVQIKNITNFGTFKCSVYDDNGVYLGTKSIILRNSLKDSQRYSLVINNGTAVYQYNENGIAPTSKSLDQPQTIQALTFTIYDDQGNPIGDNIIADARNCQIRWKFPITNTLLEDSIDNGTSSGTDAAGEYKYYDNMTTLMYNIAQRYNINDVRNQILLSVTYKGMTLTASTNFTFAKQGQPGTNGSEYLIKIVPNTSMQNPPLYPIITKVDDGNYYINYGIGSANEETVISTNNSYKFFKAQLWHSGQLVWEGFSTSQGGSFISNDEKVIDVQWSVLANKYTVNNYDSSAFVVTDAEEGQIKYVGDFLKTNSQIPMANIIKCQITRQQTNVDINEVKKKKYYATIPVVTSWVKNENYKVNLKDYTGFKYVIYTADGVLPAYDNSYPFEFICNEKINNIWENVSLVNGSHSVTCNVSSVGNVKSTYNGTINNSYNLQVLTSYIYRDGLNKNQWQVRPSTFYDGLCVNNAIVCQFVQNNTVIAYLHIPIHFLLNKYGFSHLNDWDGNSIQIDNDGGFILAPQMGAGAKNANNQFTGVLMGEVKYPGKNTSDIGLVGLANGERSFFLNSANGSALFGRQNSGQIAIDPSQNQALLYSHNFWKYYNDNGLPTSYGSSNYNGEGMLIDLTTPKILWGNGNFSIDSNGNMKAVGTGAIAGWQIGEEQVTEDGVTTKRSVLYSNISKYNGRITLDAGTISTNPLTGEKEYTGPGKIYSHNHDKLTNTYDGFYLSHDGLSIGSKFKVTDEGVVTIGAGAVSDDANASDEHWTIDSGSDQNGYRSYIQYGGSTKFSPAQRDIGQSQSNPAKVYLGTDGIALGKLFSVDAYGNLIASTATLNNVTADNFEFNSGDIYQNVTIHQSIFLNDGSTRRQINWDTVQVVTNLLAHGAKAVVDIEVVDGEEDATEDWTDSEVEYVAGESSNENSFTLKILRQDFIQNLTVTKNKMYVLADLSERQIKQEELLDITADMLKRIIEDLGYDLDQDFPLDDIDWDLFTSDLAEGLDIQIIWVNPDSPDPSEPETSTLPVDGWEPYIDEDSYQDIADKIEEYSQDPDRMYKYTKDSTSMPEIPARITVTRPPEKTEYNEGEEINYAGMIVQAWASPNTLTPFSLSNGGGLYRNVIPIDELTLTVTIAGQGGTIIQEGSSSGTGSSSVTPEPGIDNVPAASQKTINGDTYYSIDGSGYSSGSGSSSSGGGGGF